MILFDTRNQKDTFITEPMTKFGFATDRTKLPFGDIVTADNILNAVDIKSAKNGLQELAGNMFGRPRKIKARNSKSVRNMAVN